MTRQKLRQRLLQRVQQKRQKKGSEYNQLLSEGRYDEVINQIVTLSETADLPDAMKEQYSQILQQALEAQYSDFESKVADSRNSNDYDAVFSQIAEERGYV